VHTAIALIHTIVVSVCPVVVSVGMSFVYVRIVYFLCAYCNCISTCVMNLEMPVPSQGHCGFPSFPVVD